MQMNGLKLFGHPLHAAIIHFPIAAWSSALVTDAVYLVLRNLMWWQISACLLVVGSIAGIGAMMAGFLDLVSLAQGGPEQRAALRHMYLMASAWTVYTVNAVVRFIPHQSAPSSALGVLCVAMSAAGFLLLLVGTHFGARLVYDLGVGQTGRKSA